MRERSDAHYAMEGFIGGSAAGVALILLTIALAAYLNEVYNRSLDYPAINGGLQ